MLYFFGCLELGRKEIMGMTCHLLEIYNIMLTDVN